LFEKFGLDEITRIEAKKKKVYFNTALTAMLSGPDKVSHYQSNFDGSSQSLLD
jgi:spore germination protein GerM